MSNADRSELSKFDALAEDWWDLDGDFKPLHQINPLRIAFINKHIETLKNQTVLDVGCGGGILSEGLAAQGAHVTGIDLAPDTLATARSHSKNNDLEIDYQEIAVETLAEKQPQSFDVVTCMEMLEHVPDPGSIVNACCQLLKPGGFIFLSTLNRNPKSFLLAILAAEFALGMVPKGTHDYSKFIKPSELDRALRQAECRTIDMAGIRYQPLRQDYQLDRKDIDVNYLMCAQKDG